MLTGCGGPSGSVDGVTTNAPANLTSDFVNINLQTGVVRSAVTDPGAASTTLGLVKTPRGYVSVAPITKGQWLTLMGTAPWHDLTGVPAEVVGNAAADVDDHPVCNLSSDDAKAFVRALTAKSGLTMALPSDSLLTAIGEDALANAKDRCLIWETAGKAVNQGMESVTARGAVNGIYDPIGNVRMWSQDGDLVGASWLDGYVKSVRRRPDEGVRHPLAGMRVVIVN